MVHVTYRDRSQPFPCTMVTSMATVAVGAPKLSPKPHTILNALLKCNA